METTNDTMISIHIQHITISILVYLLVWSYYHPYDTFMMNIDVDTWMSVDIINNRHSTLIQPRYINNNQQQNTTISILTSQLCIISIASFISFFLWLCSCVVLHIDWGVTEGNQRSIDDGMLLLVVTSTIFPFNI